MEKYFLITEESQLHVDYYKYLENQKEVDRLVEAFFKEHGIEAEHYHAASDCIFIVPKESDNEKFKSVLGVALENGLQKFKGTSKIHKAWINALKDKSLKVLNQPRVIFYLRTGGGRFRSRLFDQDGSLYCSFEPAPLEIPKGFIEMKASEFYKVLETDSAESA